MKERSYCTIDQPPGQGPVGGRTVLPVKRIQKLLTLLLCLGLVLGACLPAGAEGFPFNWDVDDNTAPHCKSLLLYNLDTDAVVYALNPDERLPMASITKIMSYIVAYETIPDIENTVITVPESVDEELSGTGSSVAEFSPGEQFDGLTLLYLMMVPSGNNAALTLAKYVDSLYAAGKLTAEDGWTPSPAAGDEDSFDPTDYTDSSYFVHLMNQKAAALGCTDTHFTNPHGLHNPDHYSTARDLAAITRYALTLPSFADITSTTAYAYYPKNDPEDERVANTTNRMLTNYLDDSGNVYFYQFATGIKTGSLDESGYCIAASASAYGNTYIAICLGSPMVGENGEEINYHGEMVDAASLFRWALTTLEKKTLAVQGDVLSSIPLQYAWQKDELQLVAAQNVAAMLPADVETGSVLIHADVPEEGVEAPVERGTPLGTATFTYAGDEIATVELVAAVSVDRSEIIRLWDQGRDVLRAPWFQIILAVIGALIGIYILLILVYRRKQRQLRRVKRYRNL